jgi:histidyl-tRNA synthetase
LIEVLPDAFRARVLERRPVAVLPIDREAVATAFSVARQLVGRGLVAQTEVSGRSLKAGLKWAGKLGASVAILVGGSELAEGAVVVRDLDRGEQLAVPLADVCSHVGALLGRPS